MIERRKVIRPRRIQEVARLDGPNLGQFVNAVRQLEIDTENPERRSTVPCDRLSAQHFRLGLQRIISSNGGGTEFITESFQCGEMDCQLIFRQTPEEANALLRIRPSDSSESKSYRLSELRAGAGDESVELVEFHGNGVNPLIFLFPY